MHLHCLHLNVPVETGKLRALATKGRWVLIGLLAPEVVLYLACSQFLEARHLANELNRIALQESEEKIAHHVRPGFLRSPENSIS